MLYAPTLASLLRAPLPVVQWQDTVNALANDSDLEVRKTLAGVIHELARIAGKDCPTLLSRSLCRLLRDESQAVQAAVLPNLTATLQHWQMKDEARREAAMGEVARALIDMEAGIKRSWRMQQQLAVAFPSFPQVRWVWTCGWAGWLIVCVGGGGRPPAAAAAGCCVPHRFMGPTGWQPVTAQAGR